MGGVPAPASSAWLQKPYQQHRCSTSTNHSMHAARPGTAFNRDIPIETPALATSLLSEHILLAMMLYSPFEIVCA